MASVITITIPADTAEPAALVIAVLAREREAAVAPPDASIVAARKTDDRSAPSPDENRALAVLGRPLVWGLGR